MRLSRSLLSGLGACAECGGPIIISGSQGHAPCYGCAYYRNRGVTICDNRLLESIAVVDKRFLEEIERQVLTPEARRYTLARATETLRASVHAQPDQLSELRAELNRTNSEIEHLVRALEIGDGLESIVRRLREKEQRAAALKTEIKSIENATRISKLDLHRVDRVLESYLGRIGEVLRGDAVRARQALRKLLVDRISFVPSESAGDRTYRLEANVTFGRILVEEPCSMLNVPDGI